jgi:hypothetical protein
MQIELLPGTTNVVRFPVERRSRPSVELMRALVPDVREVLLIADAYGLEAPPEDLRDRTDAETAEHILNHMVHDGPERTAWLLSLEMQVVGKAIAACHAARDAMAESAAAESKVRAAGSVNAFWTETLRERARVLGDTAARGMLAAYASAEEAERAARAIGFAHRRETWMRRDHEAETDALLMIGQRLSACGAK